MTEVNISDPCGKTNYDDENHRRNPEEREFPPKTTVSVFQTESGLEPTITNAGERREVGDGLDIIEGKGANIKAFDGGIKEYNEQKEPETK